MRAAFPVAALLLLLPVSAAQPVLYVVGDGREVVVADPGDFNTTWDMTTVVPPDDETVFRVRSFGQGNVSSYPQPYFPSWNYTGDEGPVVLSGKHPVKLYAYVDHLLGGVCGRVRAQLFDQDGSYIGPHNPWLEAQDRTATPSVDELVWTFEGLAGEFPGLAAQVAPVPGCDQADFYFGTAQYQARIELGPDDRIGLPPPPDDDDGDPNVVHANLTGPTADVTLQYPSHPANRTLIYSWENPHERLNITYDVLVSEGSLDLRIDEVEGETVLHHMVDEDATHNATWDGAGPGNWTITVALHDFSGRLRLSIQDAGEAPPSTDTQTQTDTGTKDPTGAGTTTGTPPETGTETDNETPGFGLVAGLALLFMAGRAVRRRLE